MLKVFFKDSLVYFFPSLVSRGLALFLVPLYTKVLSPDDYGVFDLFIVFSGIINLTIALEISQAVARFYTSEKDDRQRVLYASSAFWFTLFCYGLFTMLSLFFIKPASELVLGKAGLEQIFGIGVFHIFLYGLVYLMQNQLRWELRSLAFAGISLTYTVTTALLSIVLAYWLNLGLEGLMLGMVCGGGLAVLQGGWLLRKSFKVRFSKTLLVEMLRFSYPLVPSGIAVWMSSYVDRMMINHYLTLEDVGLYGIGFRLASIVSLVIVGFQSALSPLIYANHEKPETPFELSRIFRFFCALSLLFFVGINFYSQELLVWFTQPAYYDAKRVIIYLVPSILFSQMYVFAPGIFIAKKTGYVLWINVMGAALNALLNWLLIPIWGFTGAAVATLISQFCVFCVFMGYSQRLYPVPHQWHRLLVATLWVVLLVWLSSFFALKGIELILISSAVLMLSIIGFVVSRVIPLAELKSLREILLKRLNLIAIKPKPFSR